MRRRLRARDCAGSGSLDAQRAHAAESTRRGETGWRWSEHIKPAAGTGQCEATHLLYCISGRMKIQHSDGTEAEIGPGDVAAIQPGHDAWVEGDGTCVSVDFGGYANYGLPTA